MLDFYRRNASVIAISIVIFFVGTMFTGAVLFGRFDPGTRPSAQSTIDERNTVAYTDSIQVPVYVYNDMLQRISGSVPKSSLRFDPEFGEQLALMALENAIEFQLLVQLADQRKIKVRRSDINLDLPQYYTAYGVKNKRELKENLAKAGVSYDLFLEMLRNNRKVQQVVQNLNAEVQVTDRDIENAFISLEMGQVFLSYANAKDSSEAGIEALKMQANAIYDEIQQGLSFSDAAKRYSEFNPNNGGDMGVLRAGNMIPALEGVAFDLGVNELSLPIRSSLGFHILKLHKRTVIPKPEDFNPETFRAQLLQKRQQYHTKETISNIAQVADFTLISKQLEAAKAKQMGAFDEAISGYSLMVSQSPSSPIPYYLLGKLYYRMGDKKRARETWEKGDIVAALHQDVAFPVIHLELGRLYKESKNNKGMREQFKKAIAEVENDRELAELTETFFESIEDTVHARKVARIITRLKDQEAAAAPKLNLDTADNIPSLEVLEDPN